MPFSSQHPNTNPMFNFEGKDFRPLKYKDSLIFVAMDACNCLEYKTEGCGPAPYLRNLDDDEKITISVWDLRNLEPSKVWPNRGLICITESGLYKLIMRSDKPVAKRFQNWVTREVLPALRKDGMYVMGEEKVGSGDGGELRREA